MFGYGIIYSECGVLTLETEFTKLLSAHRTTDFSLKLRSFFSFYSYNIEVPCYYFLLLQMSLIELYHKKFIALLECTV